MNSVEERQRARDRAADAVAPRDHVICGTNGWADPIIDRWLSTEERRRRTGYNRPSRARQ